MGNATKKIKMNSFVDMLAALPDDMACRDYLERLRVVRFLCSSDIAGERLHFLQCQFQFLADLS